MTLPIRWFALTTGLLGAISVAGCAGTGEGRTPTIQSAPAATEASEADVAFIRGMIVHHEQAIEMSAMAPSRAESQEVLTLARRIMVAQQDEIARMRRWLESGGAGESGDVDPGHHDPMHGNGEIHGMLSRAEIEGLEASSGAEFDRRFLELMIRHHEGAIAMVTELFATDGAAQDAEIYDLASDVEGEQRVEIQRMQRMLAGM